MRRLSLPSCPCLAGEAASIQLQKDRKHRVKFDAFGPVKAVVEKHVGDSITVQLDYVRPTFRSLDVNHKVVTTTPGRRLIVDMPMRYVGGSWKVADSTEAS